MWVWAWLLHAKRVEIFVLHIHGTQEVFSWHIGYNIHYVMHGYTVYTPTSQRGPSQAVSLYEASRPSIVLSGKPGDEATRAIAGAQAEVAGARAPVCLSLATPLTLVVGKLERCGKKE